MKPLWPAVCTSVLLALALVAARPSRGTAEGLALRGAWVWGLSCKDKASADSMLARAREMNLNALYVLVFYWGATATYHSDLVPTNGAIADGFDPLAYLVRQGHRQGLEIHTWFVNGSSASTSGIFVQHPSWMARDALGRLAPWFDLAQPDVRDWEAKLMLEVVRNYDVDGVHFDYIRFPDKSLCFGPVCRQRVREEAGINLDDLTYPALPAYGPYRGNPLASPTTATVLAHFGDGTPAIAVNDLGSGRVILFNWHADVNPPLAVDTAMRNALGRLGVPAGGQIRILDSDINAVRYGHSLFQSARDWIEALGFQTLTISDADLLVLPAGAPVVLPAHYLMTDAQAQALLGHVRAGGGALFLDGPVFAVRDFASARELLGFSRLGSFFNENRLLLADAVPGSFVPSDNRTLVPEEAARLQADWDRWRMNEITKLVADVHDRVKQYDPNRRVTAAVFYTQAAADAVLQDWPRWIHQGLLDYAIPMAYVDTPEQLDAAFAWWKTLDPGLAHIVPGIAPYKFASSDPAEYAARISAMVNVVQQEGAWGVVLFRLGLIPDETARILGQTVFKTGTGAPVSPADFNGDGTVDFRDFLLFAPHYGAAEGSPQYDSRYDLTGDGVVDFRDFLQFARAYGSP